LFNVRQHDLAGGQADQDIAASESRLLCAKQFP